MRCDTIQLSKGTFMAFYRYRWLIVCAAAVFALSPARGQDEPAKDHPSIPRFPGFYMDDGKETDFDSNEFTLGEDKTKSVEGKSWRYRYNLKEGARTPSG